MTVALLTAENILAGNKEWDVWAVNEDAQYHESGEDRTLALSERMVPRPIDALILISTPAGRLSLFNASIVFAVA